jgi:hypothetical protein
MALVHHVARLASLDRGVALLPVKLAPVQATLKLFVGQRLGRPSLKPRDKVISVGRWSCRDRLPQPMLVLALLARILQRAHFPSVGYVGVARGQVLSLALFPTLLIVCGVPGAPPDRRVFAALRDRAAFNPLQPPKEAPLDDVL